MDFAGDGLAVLHDEGDGLAVAGQNGRGGDAEGFAGFEDDRQVGHVAGDGEAAGRFDPALDFEGAQAGVDRRAAIGDGVRAGIAAVDPEAELRLAGNHFGIVLGGEIGGGLDDGEVVDAQEDAADGHLLAGLGIAGAHRAGNRRDNLGVGEIFLRDGNGGLGLLDLPFGEVHLGLGDGDGGLGRLVLHVGAFELVVADAAVPVEPFVAIVIEGGLAGLGLRFLRGSLGDGAGGLGDGEILLGDGQGVLPVGGIDLEEGGFAGDDGVAFVHPDGVEVAVGAGGHVGVVFGFERALDGQAPFEGARGDGLGADGQRADGGFGGDLFFAAAGREEGGGEGRGDEEKGEAVGFHVTSLLSFRAFVRGRG